jgi:hypothetical protein
MPRCAYGGRNRTATALGQRTEYERSGAGLSLELLDVFA